MERDNFRLDSRLQITPGDLKKCMDKILRQMGSTKEDRIYVVPHPLFKGNKLVTPYLIEFEVEHRTKNIKLVSDLAIVLKY